MSNTAFIRAKYIFYTHSIIFVFWLFLYVYFVIYFWRINVLLWQQGQTFLAILFGFIIFFIVLLMLILWWRSWRAFKQEDYETTIKSSVFGIAFMTLPIFFVWLLQ